MYSKLMEVDYQEGECPKEVRRYEFNTRQYSNGTSISIMPLSSYGPKEKSPVYGVNWGGMGTKTVDDSKWFLSNLIEAIDWADKMNEEED